MGHKHQPLADRPLGPARPDLRILAFRGRRLAKIGHHLLLYTSLQLEGQDADNLLHGDGPPDCNLARKCPCRLSPMQTVGVLVGQDNPGRNMFRRAAFLSGTSHHESYPGRGDTRVACQVNMGSEVARE